MVDPEVVASRLAVLRRNVDRLRAIVEHGSEAFVSDEDLHLKAERCLQLALQAMLDIGTHVVATERLSRPERYEDVVPELAKAGFLPEELAERLEGSAGLRNILVHDYVSLDLARLYETIRQGIPDLEAFAEEISNLLDAAP